MNTIRIGSLNLSVQALITAVLGIVAGLAIIIAAPQLWFLSLFIIIAFFANAYTINCTLVGHCYTWAWILVAVAIILFLNLMITVWLTRKDLAIGFNIAKQNLKK